MTKPIDIDFLRRQCMSLAGTTEQVQWGYDLVFKVGGKMYAVAPLEPAPVCLSFKCSPEDFADLTERPGIIPAPYMARAQWVALEHEEALSAAEMKRYVRRSYELVRAKLPKKIQAELAIKR
jgi:predicted DNA-binding protein (MmcQ/YjbR family)